MMKALRLFICLLIITCSLSGCKKVPSSEKERPVVNSISFNLTQATPGTKISVTGIATDPQGDQLTYTWSSEQGTISDPNNPSTDWVISPTCQSNSNAKISLTVSDGKVSSSLDKEIPIVMGVTVSGKAIYKGTSIPLSGVNIKMGPFSTLTATDGTFVIFHIAPGSNTLEAHKPGFDTFVDTEDISSDKYFELSMTSGTETRKIYGSVKTIDSIPLNGIRVIMLNNDMTESTLTCLTDIDGSYQISDIPQGTRYFKFLNESNSNNCQTVTSNIEVADVDEKLIVRMKILRSIDILQNGWEFKTSDLSAPYNGTSYVLTTDGTNSTITNKLFRPAYCCPIPIDADYPQVVMNQRLTGTFKTPGQVYFKSPASTQFYMGSDCNAWPDYAFTIYTYWSSAVNSFTLDYLTINSSYKGTSLKLTFGLFRWSGAMPLWEIKSLGVTYFY
jgi:hypothetical protein